MATLIFGLSQSLDGYVDHLEMRPGPALFRHFVEHVRNLAGSVYGRRTYEALVNATKPSACRTVRPSRTCPWEAIGRFPQPSDSSITTVAPPERQAKSILADSFLEDDNLNWRLCRRKLALPFLLPFISFVPRAQIIDHRNTPDDMFPIANGPVTKLADSF